MDFGRCNIDQMSLKSNEVQVAGHDRPAPTVQPKRPLQSGVVQPLRRWTDANGLRLTPFNGPFPFFIFFFLLLLYAYYYLVGQTWTWTAVPDQLKDVRTLAVDPTNPKLLYALAPDCLSSSTDHGGNLVRVHERIYGNKTVALMLPKLKPPSC